MPRFAANLTMLFTEVPMLDRPGLAAQAGFDGVEVLFPYDHAIADWQAALARLPLALVNTPPGDWLAGDRGFAAVPGEEARFRDSFLRGADLAARLGADRLHVMAGVARGAQAEQAFVENLAARILDDLAVPQVQVQFDLGHAARIEGNAQMVWDRHKSRVGHIQIAGFPGRNEPGGGGFDLTGLCSEVDAMGYDGWIAGEYRPARATVHGLAWLQALKARAALIGA